MYDPNHFLNQQGDLQAPKGQDRSPTHHHTAPKVQQPEQRPTKRVKPGQHTIDLAKNDDPPQTPSVRWAGTFRKREAGNQPTQVPPIKPKRKPNAIPPRTLNTDSLAQFIGTDTIVEALIDDVPTKVLLDMGAMIDMLPISYTNAAGLEMKPLSLITDKHVTMSLAAGQYLEAVGYTEFNLKVPGISGYDMDRLALLLKDDSNYSKRVSVALGTKTLDSIMYAMKEGEIELLEEVWK